jgi:hypothetical protein
MIDSVLAAKIHIYRTTMTRCIERIIANDSFTRAFRLAESTDSADDWEIAFNLWREIILLQAELARRQDSCACSSPPS